MHYTVTVRSLRKASVSGRALFRCYSQPILEQWIHLQFYNGQEFPLEETAIYKSAGFFVDQEKTDQREFPLCVFEILPHENGVKFADPSGACKIMSYGERGGYNGAQFSFKDRHQSIASAHSRVL